MRKNIFGTILFAAALAIAAISCQKSMDEFGATDSNDGTIDIKVNAAMGQYSPAEATKAGRVAVTRVSWKGGETVYVYGGTQYLGSLVTTLDGTEDRYALLSTDATHTVEKPADGTTKLTLVYSPLLTTAPTVSEGTISVSLVNQSGATAPFVAFATLDYINGQSLAITKEVVPFKLATSLINVSSTGAAANSDVYMVWIEGLNTECTLTLHSDKEPEVGGAGNGHIKRTEATGFDASSVGAEGGVIFQLAVPPVEESQGTRKLFIFQRNETAFVDRGFSKAQLANGVAVNTVCSLKELVIPEGAIPIPFELEGRLIWFSKGNLQAKYNSQTKKYEWGFANSQLDFVGNKSGNTTIKDDGTNVDGAVVDLFCWTAKGKYSDGMKQYGINKSGTDSDYSTTDFRSDQLSDCGDAYCISKGISTGTWYTPSADQWRYLIDRNNGTKYGDVSITRTYSGFVVLPEDYSGTLDPKLLTQLTWTDWQNLEKAGAVFLPYACQRQGNYVFDKTHHYQTSTSQDETVHFSAYSSLSGRKIFESTYRYEAAAVRLISDIK